MRDEKLILYVQQHSFLYDNGDPRYNNQILRDNAWSEIGRRMGCKDTICKSRWKSLRDTYRKSLKQRNTKSTHPNYPNYQKTWKFDTQMEFLKRYLINPTEGSTDDVTSDVEQDTSDTPDVRESLDSETPLPKRRRPTQQFFMSATELDNSCNEKKVKIDKPEDHLTKYFASVEETVRTFPMHLQIRIKSQISNILHHTELEAIMFPTVVPTQHQTYVLSTPATAPESNAPEFEFAEITKNSPKYGFPDDHQTADS